MAKKVFRKDASLIFMAHFGSLNIGVILCIVLLFVSLDLLSTAVNDIMTAQVNGTFGVAMCIVRFVPFPVLLSFFLLRARKTSRRVHTVIAEHVYPRPVKVLVMFLSTKGRGKDDALIEKLIKGGGSVTDDKLRASFQESWRMPLEAIAHHIKRLEKVIVIPSQESEQQVEQFKSLVRSLTREQATGSGTAIEVLSLADLSDLRVYLDPEDTKGWDSLAYVDFENAQAQNTILNAVLDCLMDKEKVPVDELVIDVTAGKKISSIVGTVVALGKDWSVEYVSVIKDIVRVKEYVFTVKASDVKYNAS